MELSFFKGSNQVVSLSVCMSFSGLSVSCHFLGAFQSKGCPNQKYIHLTGIVFVVGVLKGGIYGCGGVLYSTEYTCQFQRKSICRGTVSLIYLTIYVCLLGVVIFKGHTRVRGYIQVEWTYQIKSTSI